METEEAKIEKKMSNGKQQRHSYVPQSAIALRCRVMPPPCIRNPYLSDVTDTDIDPFGNQRSKCAGMCILHVNYGVMWHVQIIIIVF